MSWNGTATTLTWPPVRASQSGARRWSGSATCGPLKVRMLIFTPANEGALGAALSAGAAGLSLGSAAIAVGENAVPASVAVVISAIPRMNPSFAMSLLLPTTAAGVPACLPRHDWNSTGPFMGPPPASGVGVTDASMLDGERYAGQYRESVKTQHNGHRGATGAAATLATQPECPSGVA